MNPISIFGLLRDGAQVLFENITIISVFSVNVIGIGVWILLGISVTWANREWNRNGAVLLSMGICGFVLLSYAIVAISRIWHGALPILSDGLLIFSLLGLVAGLLYFVKKKTIRFADFVVPLVILALTVLVRFAFLKGLDYPLYHDSVVHYQIIQDLQNPSQSPRFADKVLDLISGRYYHIGFHSTVVVLSTQLGGSFPEAQLLLITGHMFLLALILNAGLLASKIFHHAYAGISTVIAAGLGWSMPAFAINWGKYPAISSLAVLPLVAYWLIDAYEAPEDDRRLPSFLGGIAALCAVLLHSRSLLLLGCGLAVLATLKLIETRLSKDRVGVLFGAEIGLILLIGRFQPNFQPALVPYFKGIDLGVTLFAVALTVFVARQNTRAIIGILTFLMVLALFATIRTPEFLVRQAGRYLVDRPFLQILLFLPLSVLVGGGLAYLIRQLRSRLSSPRIGTGIVSAGLISLTLLTILLRPYSDFKPSSCCNYMGIDDIFLIGWMQENIPKDSRILISTNADFNTKTVKVGTDAGIWITPLTARETIKFDYRTDFSKPALQHTLCQERIQYIYVSLVNTSFSLTQLEESPQEYSPTLLLPEARLYRVNCHTGSAD